MFLTKISNVFTQHLVKLWTSVSKWKFESQILCVEYSFIVAKTTIIEIMISGNDIAAV